MQWSLFLLIVMGQRSFARMEYHFIQDNKTWSEAQKYCREKYTDLATVYDMEDMRRLRNATKNQNEAWIGLRNEKGNKTWHWSLPGVEFNENETNWREGEPNDIDAKENCVAMEEDNLWNDVVCTKKCPFLCYEDRPNATEKFIRVEKDLCWSEAQNYCRQNHTDLVSGLKQLNGTEVTTLLNNTGKQCWLFGLFRDKWRWSDGSQSSFRNWMLSCDHHPDNGTCAVTTSGEESRWKTDDCNSTKPFFCYKDDLVLIKEKKTWEDALYYCREHHYDLVSITDPNQQIMVQEKAKRAQSPFVWIGLRYTCTLDFWFWVTDEVVGYKKWASGGEIKDCDMSGAMDRGGQHDWFSKIDSMKFNFICWT